MIRSVFDEASMAVVYAFFDVRIGEVVGVARPVFLFFFCFCGSRMGEASVCRLTLFAF
jgi:hypothetical protein